jgi:PBSX family phage terminase large subunit
MHTKNLELLPPKGKGAWSIANANKRQNIWHGSVRSTKTVNSLIKFSHWTKNEAPVGGDILFTGRTRDTVKRNVLYPLRRYVGRRNCKFSIVNGEGKLYGRIFYIVGANDETSEERIRGLTLAGVYIDEITIIPESFYRMALSRLSLDGSRLYGTTNPDGPFHWLKKEIDKDMPQMSVFHFTLDDNPYISQQYKDDLKAEYGEGTLWYKRYYLGLWVQAQGAVYDMWDESRHVIKDLPAEGFDWYYTWIDYGTANPCAFGYNGVKDGKVTCIKEYYYDGRNSQKQKTDMDIYYDLHAFLRGVPNRWIILDPSALSLKTQLKKEEMCRDCQGTGKVNGAKCETCTGKGKMDPFTNLKDCDNSVLDGIRTLSSFLQNGRYHVHESCKNHRMEFGAYTWNSKAQAKGEDVPMKVNDHTMDGARYGVHTLFGQENTGGFRAAGRKMGGKI